MDEVATFSSENALVGNEDATEKKIADVDEYGVIKGRGKFKATMMWNEILCAFCKDMPVKKHRRQLKSFENTFTGSEGVDFLLRQLADRNDFNGENRTISRLNAVALLNKFYLQGVFEIVRPTEKSGFRDDNTLYKFVMKPTSLAPLLAHNRGVLQRRSTFNQQDRLEVKPIKSRGPVTPIKYRKLESPTQAWMQPQSCEDAMDDRPKTPLNRRLSASHGALSSLKDDELYKFGRPMQCISQQTLSSAADSTETLIDFNPKEKGGEESIDERDEMSEKEHAGPSSKVRSLTEVRLVCRLLGDAEVANIWKSALTSRLETLLKTERLDSFLCDSFEGKDVKWNSEQIGKSGIVRQNFDRKDEPPRWVLLAMRCLTRWPFENHVVTLPATYPGFERDVFTNVCHYFAQELTPLLSDEMAVGLLDVIRHCQQLDMDEASGANVFDFVTSSSLGSTKSLLSPALPAEDGTGSNVSDPASPCMRIETEFSGLEPVTRMLLVSNAQPSSLNGRRTVSSVDAAASKSAFARGARDRASCALPTAWRSSPLREYRRQREHIQLIDESSSVLHSVRRRVTFNDDYENEPSPEAIQSLPGLVLSPSVMRRIEQARMRSSLTTPLHQCGNPGSRLSIASSCCLMAPSKGAKPVGILADMSKEGRERCLSAIGLILMTLPPRRRRRLHYLVRFMHKVTLNHCLKLDPIRNRENRYTVLEALSSTVVDASDKLTVSQALRLVTVLLDNEDEVFRSNNELKSDVQSKIADMQRER
uniref:DEP domain-containing protein n=1 Tax=Plectus sambesii TaxID=2011161 RepID=A0A914VSJ9_9BILA